MKARRFPPEAVERVWDQVRRDRGYRCHFTRVPLVMDDITSQWYCVFDHLTPLDPRHIVLTCALFNEMKSALSEPEFNTMVIQLDDYRCKGKTIKKIRLAYWRHFYKNVDQQQKLSVGHAHGKIKGKKCCICGRPVFRNHSKYCLRCSNFEHRLKYKGFSAEAIQAIWDYVRRHGYVCYYTGLPLEMDNAQSPWYGEFNFWMPGIQSKVVLTCAVFNEMKTDLSEKEFWYYIHQLANYFRFHLPIKRKKLVYWYRLTPKEPLKRFQFGNLSLH